MTLSWHQTDTAFPDTATLLSLFEAQAQATPFRIAAQDEEKKLTYQELNQYAQCLAEKIYYTYADQNLIPPDSLIALFLDRSVDMLIAILATFKLGCAYVPIDPQFPRDRIQYILNDAQTNIIFTQTHLRTRIETLSSSNLWCMDDDTLTSGKQHEHTIPRHPKPSDLAYVIYTSGTTGKPKGVAVPHQGVVNRLHWMQTQYPLFENDIILQKTPYSFDVSVWELLWANQVGASILFAKPQGHLDPLYLDDLIQRYRVTVTHFVPSMLSTFTQVLQKANRLIPQTLRYVFCSGEALLPSQVNAFYDQASHAVTLHNLYGPTEASIDVTYFPCTPNLPKIYIGRPIQNTMLLILDDTYHEVPVGEIGELYIGGIGLARGYWNNPELTASKFITYPADPSCRLYKTGDLARWDHNGYLEYIGRNDFQVKIRGVRIELNEIEAVLSTYPQIQQTVVLVQQAHDQAYLIAYYGSVCPIEAEHLRDFLKQSLPHYMIPHAFIHQTHFPLSTHGKLDRQALPRYVFESHAPTMIDTPKTATETSLVTLWSDMLNLSQLSLDDHFLQLGGHSLLAAQMISAIQTQWQKTIGFSQFYQAGTIRKLAKILDETPIITSSTPTVSPTTTISTHQHERLPLTDFQLIIRLSHLFEPKVKKMNIVTRKRLDGRIDAHSLKQAFIAVIKKHPSLSYQISKFYPAQTPKTCRRMRIQKIKYLTHARYPEKILSRSAHRLFNLDRWPKQSPLVHIRMFYLPNNQTELQICMPHWIADERSMDVFCEDLSKAYLIYQHNPEYLPPPTPSTFFNYIHEEQQMNAMHLDEKINFWDHYLKQTRLFRFPSTAIVRCMHKKNLSYSTYCPLPSSLLHQMRTFCYQHHLHLDDLICAAVSKVLVAHDIHPHKHDPVLINMIKSTRHTAEYNEAIGCFVRVDPIKIHAAEETSLIDLSHAIHQSTLNSWDEQRLSTLLKFSCFIHCYHKKSWFKGQITRALMPLYIQWMKQKNIVYHNYKMFELCWRLASYNRKDVFLVNLNIWNNFLHDEKNPTLFDLTTLHHPMSQHELSNLDDILDICFMKHDATQKPYIVISSNLTPDFRTQIAQNIIDLLSKSTAISLSSDQQTTAGII